MLDLIGHVNGIAVLAASIVAFVLGGVWFMLVVDRAYLVALGRQNAPPPPRSALSLAGPFVCQMVIALTSALLLRALGVTTYRGALQLGFIVGLGYLAPMTVNIALNPNFPRPLLYSLINVPYFLLTSITTCVTLVALA